MFKQTSVESRALSSHFVEFLDLPDERLSSRMGQVVNSIQHRPALSFPAIFSKKSELDGFYRLVNNDRVVFSKVIDAVCTETVHAAASEDRLLAIHDTTDFSFPTESKIEGVGRLSRGKTGFFGHFCLGVSVQREVIGVLGLKPWIRSGKPMGTRSMKTRKSDPNNESYRWINLIQEVHQKLGNHPNVIHVADREADDYASLSQLIEQKIRFLFRARYDRNIRDESYSNLFESLQDAQVICQREVPLCARKKSVMPNDRKTHPEREKRMAQLGVSAKSIEICRSKHVGLHLPKTLTLNFVRVFEYTPPEGQKPIEWILVTTEPIENTDQLLEIVDIYRARWTIEEYFKALKTGCSFEKRGFESLHALLNCLALFAPLACKLYNLKMLGREQSEKAVSDRIVSSTQIKILAHSIKQNEQQLQTAGAVMGAIAALGGHLKHNGLPGWQVLGRGYEKLLQLEQGWLMAHQFTLDSRLARCDM